MPIKLLGSKIGMTQLFDELSNIVPVTILRIGPCQITQIKTSLLNKTNSIQIGFESTINNRLTQPILGHLEKSNCKPVKYLKEFKIDKNNNFKVGQTLKVNHFKVGQLVNVSGKTVGKGFSGLQKRYNFSRGPMTHGSKNHRAPGSIGMGTTPGRVLPGKKMAGQLGNQQVTVKNLEIILINNKENLLAVKGAVPGKIGNLITIVSAEKNEMV